MLKQAIQFAALFAIVVGMIGCGGGGSSSSPDASNVAPVANAGTLQNVTVGTVVTLNGGASSDANNDPLTYSWTLTSVPAFSAATLSGASTVAPTFTADMAGTYVASLTVNDGKVNSTSATVNINAAKADVAIGAGTAGAINPADSTTYKRSMAVLVADSNGNPVPYAVVTLSVWPEKYYKGHRDTSCNAITFGPFISEDINANGILDVGEDIDGPGGYTLGASSATLGTPDQALWPAASAAGTVLTIVTTDSNGAATFDWVYSKQYADWVYATIRASVQFQGIQYSTSGSFSLNHPTFDSCTLPGSPFN